MTDELSKEDFRAEMQNLISRAPKEINIFLVYGTVDFNKKEKDLETEVSLSAALVGSPAKLKELFLGVFYHQESFYRIASGALSDYEEEREKKLSRKVDGFLKDLFKKYSKN